MHSLFEVLLISFSIASSRAVRAYDLLPDNVDFTPYTSERYFDTQREDGKLLSELTVDLETRDLGSLSLNDLFARQTRTDLQTFTGALGGIKAPSITQSTDQERPYQVQANTFPNYMEAATRTCDIQKNGCADMVNAQGGADDQAGNQDGDGADDGADEPQSTTTNRQTPQNAVQQSTRSQQSTSSTRTRTSALSSASSQQNNRGNNQQQGNNNGGNQQQGNNNGNGTASANNNKFKRQNVNMQMCEQQMSQCNTVVRAAAVQSFDTSATTPQFTVNLGQDPNDPNFDLLCTA